MIVPQQSGARTYRSTGAFTWVFRATDGRVRAGWRVVLFLLGFLLVCRAATFLTVVAAAGLVGVEAVEEADALVQSGAPWEDVAKLPRPLPYLTFLSSTFALPAVWALVWLFRRKLDRRSWQSLGLSRDAGLGRDVRWGLVVGALVIALTVLPLLVTGSVGRAGWGWTEGSPGRWAADLGILLGLLVAAAFLEELVVRGYVLRNLWEAVGPVAAVLISSALFAAFHLGNPNFSRVALVNIFLAGVLMGSTLVLTGRLWMPWAVHVAWNAVLGMVVGSPVSGLNLPSLLRLETSGSELATGGHFGLEASVWNTAALAIMIFLLVWRGRRLFADGEGSDVGHQVLAEEEMAP